MKFQGSAYMCLDPECGNLAPNAYLCPEHLPKPGVKKVAPKAKVVMTFPRYASGAR